MSPHIIKRLFPNASASVLAANAGDYGSGQPQDSPVCSSVNALESFLPPNRPDTAEHGYQTAGGALNAKDENPSAYSRFFPCVPPTASAQQKGVFMAGGKPRFFTKSKMKKSQKALAAIFAPHRPSEPFCGPIRVQIVFIYPWRKAESKHTMAKYSRYPIEQRPDVENQAKGALDVLTECRFWYDDSQISTLTASKYRGDVPGIEIMIQPEHGEPK